MSTHSFNLLYRLIFAVAHISVISFAIFSLQRAMAIGRTDYVRWLKPFVIGDSLQLFVFLCSTAFQYHLFGRGHRVEIAYAIALADFIPVGIIVFGAFIMWQTLKMMQSHTLRGPDSWPPAPQSPEERQ